jgi:pentatricopeptide repeat protein
VEVTGFTENAPTLVQYAVKVGDRVLAVDSSLGDKMWPVSTVEGVISAVTSRLPGQQISMRFERPLSNMDTDAGSMKSVTVKSSSSATSVRPSVDQKELLSRCRGIIRRYMTEEQQKARSKFAGKYAVPALVADKVLEALANAEAQVDSVTLSLIMTAYISCQKPEGAIRAFEAAVGLNSNGSSLPVVSQQGDKLIVANIAALNVYTASSLLNAHALNDDLASIKRVLEAMAGSIKLVDGLESTVWPGDVKPDTGCYNIAISAAAKSSAVYGFEMAMALFHKMCPPGQETAGVPPRDLTSYNIVLSALTRSKVYVEALELFSEMKKAGLKPDKYSYTALINAVISNGDVDELLYEMKEQGVEADVVTYNSIIKSLCADRKFVSAKKMVNQMEASGVAPDSMTYGLLMSGLLKAGNPGACVTLFESACADRRTVPLTENVFVYTTAITAAAALADHERAFDLISRMNSLGIKPNMKTLTALIGACLASGKAALAADIYRRMEKPDAYAMEQGLRALCLAGFPNEAFTAVAKQVHGSRLLRGKQMMTTYETIIHTALKRNDYDLARQALTDLLQKGSIPSKVVFQTMFDAMDLFPQRRKALVEAPTIDQYASEKFSFMLFVLDAVQGRNLPCEGSLYSAIVTYGVRLGGLPRKIASLLQSARMRTEAAVASDGDGIGIQPVVSRWGDVLVDYDKIKDQLRTAAALPSLEVRIASKDVRKVLSAEQSLSFAGRLGKSRRR